ASAGPRARSPANGFPGRQAHPGRLPLPRTQSPGKRRWWRTVCECRARHPRSGSEGEIPHSSCLLRIPGGNAPCGSANNLGNYRHEMLNAKWLLHAGSTGAPQCCRGLRIDNVAGDENQPLQQLGTVRGNPLVHVGAVYAAGGPHVGNNAEETAILSQEPQRFGTGSGRDHGVTGAFKRGLHKRHYRGLVLDQEDRGAGSSHGSHMAHAVPPECAAALPAHADTASAPVAPAAAADSSAASRPGDPNSRVAVWVGRRTVNVAPTSGLLRQVISPPCSRTMP